MQRVVPARFEEEKGAGLRDLELVAAVAVLEQQPVQRGAGRNGVTLLGPRFPVGEDVDGRAPRSRKVGLFE